jgi:hypothetical protein
MKIKSPEMRYKADITAGALKLPECNPEQVI